MRAHPRPLSDSAAAGGCSAVLGTTAARFLKRVTAESLNALIEAGRKSWGLAICGVPFLANGLRKGLVNWAKLQFLLKLATYFTICTAAVLCLSARSEYLKNVCKLVSAIMETLSTTISVFTHATSAC